MRKNCLWKDRVKIELLDFFSYYLTIMALMFTVLIVLLTISDIFLLNIMESEDSVKTLVYILYLGTEKPYALIKDFLFKNGSLGKKMMKCRVIDSKTGEKPKPIKLLLRNLLQIDTLFIIIGIIVSYKRLDSRTLADIITKTDVIYLEEAERYE